MTKALTYVEIDVPAFSQNSPPDSPPIEETLRFAVDTDYLPSSIDCIPSIKSVQIRPVIVSLGEDLGQRASITVVFKDHKHKFAAESYDSGTFWGKFRARHGQTLRGYALRLYRGFLGDTLGSMETRHYFIEETEGPTSKGEYKITAKDVIKAASDERSQAPLLSAGRLLADITETSTSATLTPTGVGDTDYPAAASYVSLGGNELVVMHRDANTVSLIHFDGDDASQVFRDSARDRVLTAVGNAAIDNGVTQTGFGETMILDGTDDGLNITSNGDFAVGTGDFTIEVWVRLDAGAITQSTVYDGRNTEPHVMPLIYIVAATGGLRYYVNGADRITGGNIPTVTWTHVAVSRSGTSTRMFLNGTQTGATYVAADNFATVTNAFLGVRFDGVTDDWDGNFDEFRFSNVARYTSNFTVASSPFTVGTGTGDTIYFGERGALGTDPASHDAGTRVQEILQYTNEDVADILYDLWTSYAGVDPSLINLTNWQTETAAYLGGATYSALIGNPTAVKDLISELIEQAALAHWWDDTSQQIKLQVLRPISTSADTFTQENYLSDSLEYEEQPDKRVSQVWTYFGQVNPLLNLDQEENYRNIAITIDSDAESDYGNVPAIRKVFSRWIPSAARATADQLNDILLARYRDPPRRFKFSVLRGAGTTPVLGVGYNLEGYPFQETDGTAETVPVQVVSLDPGDAIITVEAEEALYSGFSPSSPDARTVRVDISQNNFNLLDAYTSAYGAPTSGVTVTCVVDQGVTIGSSSVLLPAFDVGTWTLPATLILRVRGRIQGAGGLGGRNDIPPSGFGEAGKVGGPALYTRESITLDLTTGDAEVWGGGGGGGGTDASTTGGKGGGGAGTVPGQPGPGTIGAPGSPGTSEAGGAGGDGTNFDGGAGGGPGLTGSTAQGSNPGTGGAAGAAIDGVSFVTFSGSGDRRGSEIN